MTHLNCLNLPKLIVDADGMTIRADDESQAIVFVQPPDLNNGEYDYVRAKYASNVVKCVNLHDELLDALDACAGYLDEFDDQELVKKVNAAIAKAMGGAA